MSAAAGDVPLRVAISNPRRTWGGASSMAVLLAEELPRHGHQVLVLCRPGSALESRLRAAGLPHEAVLRGPDFPPPSVWRAARALRRHGIDVLLSATSNDARLGALAAWLSGIPVVVRGLGLHALPGNRLDQALWRRVTTMVVANSAATADVLRDAHPWLRQPMLAVVPNAVDVAAFADARPIDEAAIRELAPGAPDPAALTVGYVGRLDPEKGPDVLIDAWGHVRRRLPGARLLVVGAGGLQAQLRRASRGWPEVVWFGYRDRTAPIIAALDLLVVPSRRESFGMAAAEAMAAGVPVIASRVGGLPEVLTDGVHGRLVPPLRPDALADAIVALGSDPILRARMAAAGAAHARAAYAPATAARGYLRAFRRVLEDRPGSARDPA